jgi:hypothetical protein
VNVFQPIEFQTREQAQAPIAARLAERMRQASSTYCETRVATTLGHSMKVNLGATFVNSPNFTFGVRI